MILAIKTSQDPVEICLLNSDGKVVAEKKWRAERTLAKSLLSEIEQLFTKTEPIKSWKDLTGVIVFRGPGSFTGLRIGITTANAVAYAQKIPIIGSSGTNWLDEGVEKLTNGQDDKIVLPEYGAPPHITVPKK